jgi:FKBP-type peptidyl-prolyl cis-trans isomerase
VKKVVILLSVLALAAAVVAQDTTKVEKAKSDVTKLEAKAATEVKADSTKAATGVKHVKAVPGQKKAELKKAGGKVAEVAWTTTKSGLKYRDIKVGTGEEVTMGSTPSVDYTGWFWVNGAKGGQFDSSKGKAPYAVRNIGHGQVIAGWNEGLIGMKVGGVRELMIPPALGYGSKDYGPIPGNSTLFFEVEITKVAK